MPFPCTSVWQISLHWNWVKFSYGDHFSCYFDNTCTETERLRKKTGHLTFLLLFCISVSLQIHYCCRYSMHDTRFSRDMVLACWRIFLFHICVSMLDMDVAGNWEPTKILKSPSFPLSQKLINVIVWTVSHISLILNSFSLSFSVFF